MLYLWDSHCVTFVTFQGHKMKISWILKMPSLTCYSSLSIKCALGCFSKLLTCVWCTGQHRRNHYVFHGMDAASEQSMGEQKQHGSFAFHRSDRGIKWVHWMKQEGIYKVAKVKSSFMTLEPTVNLTVLNSHKPTWTKRVIKYLQFQNWEELSKLILLMKIM